MSKLESGSSTETGEPEEPADEWPEYVQPTGAHDAYHVGDKITYKGEALHVCDGWLCVDS